MFVAGGGTAESRMLKIFCVNHLTAGIGALPRVGAATILVGKERYRAPWKECPKGSRTSKWVPSSRGVRHS